MCCNGNTSRLRFFVRECVLCARLRSRRYRLYRAARERDRSDEQQDDKLAAESKRIGYPQLIKASAGGGGKGMRLVEAEKDFIEALLSARREASAAFGDDKMLIERYLSKPRHIEMQIFADSHGNCVHLFERDCSIQRRHQKVLEEAPAPGLSEELRGHMGEAAIDCARAIGYLGAGTVEFLLDADGSFYFMEMNTRLQVEHPVSEMITGQDLVEWQLRVATGEPLPLQQQQIVPQGHALEARIYAENPQRDFMPAAGQIGYLQLPELNAGVRVDTGVRCGDTIGINYDPMIAKLIVHGPDRATAVARLAHALQQYQILGLHTNLGFLSSLVAMPEFVAADFDTSFIATHHERLFGRDDEGFNHALVLAAAAMLPALDSRAQSGVGNSPWDSRSQWRMNQQASQCVRLEHEGTKYEVVIGRRHDGWKFTCNDIDYLLDGGWVDPQRMRLEVNGGVVEFPVLREQDSIALVYQGQAFKFDLANINHDAGDAATDADHPRAPMSGAVVALPVAVGDTVEPGTTLVVIEAMKMEHAIVAQLDASVSEILVAVGDQVEEGDTLILLEVE